MPRQIELMERAALWEPQLAYAVIPDVLPDEDLLTITRRLDRLSEGRAGTRTLLDEPWCAVLGQRLLNDSRLRTPLPRDPHVAQCTLFESRWTGIGSSPCTRI